MPGKHAPEAPWSFYASVGRSAAGALAVLGVVVLIAVIAVNSRSDEEPGALGGDSPTPTTSVEPTRSTRASPATRSPSPRQEPSVRPRSEVSVQVLNGNGRTGSAGVVSSELENDGYAVVEPANAEIINRTIIYHADGYEDDAIALRDRHFEYAKDARIRPREPGIGDEDAGIVVVIGKDHPA